MYPGPSSSRGFTLIEILIVMVLITMVTSFTVPALRSNLYSDELKATARKLVGLVSEASQEAVSRQRPYLLKFDLEHDLVWISPEQALPDEAEQERRKQLSIPDSVRVADIASVHGGKRSAGETAIRFTEKGYVDRTFIHLRADDGREMTLMLSPFIAVTRISDSYVELEEDLQRF